MTGQLIVQDVDW